LEHTTTIDKPFFSWKPLTNEVTDEITNDGVAVMGVDILPTEISAESSEHFSESLLPLLKQLITNDYNKVDDDMYAKLSPELVSHCPFLSS
jgi:alpha-aminoadipic semialdehyde synthase